MLKVSDAPKNIYILLRTIAERMSRNVVLKRRLPDRYGGHKIFVSPGALLKFWHPNLEAVDTSLFSWASKYVKNGDVVWDIGANVGLFTFAAASLSGPHGCVVAVEADIWLANLLNQSTHKVGRQRSPISVLPVAVGGAMGIAQFNIAMRSRASNYLSTSKGNSQTGGVRETSSVPVVTLDWLLEHCPAPHIIKIDVEGAEYEVLKGGTRLLSEVQPTIICEVAEDNAKDVSELLHSFGYTLFDLASKGERELIEVATFNTLACHSSLLLQ